MLDTYKPDPSLDVERMELLETTLGPLIDRHLRWTPSDKSPTSTLSDREYGYIPKVFDDSSLDTEISLRPNQEPLDFRIIAGEVLGIDSESLAFEDEVRKIDGHGDFPDSNADFRSEGWFRFLIRSGLDKDVVVDMKQVSEEAFRVSANTEDNVPAYELETMGRIRTISEKYGLVFPAHEEWYRGIWIAEEDAHKEGQSDYGKIRRITTSLSHKVSKNSQLRYGTDVDSSMPFKMAIYTTIQEFSTKLAHKRNSLLFGPVGHRLQEEESQDETKHYDLYGRLVRAAYQDPRFTEEIIYLFDSLMQPKAFDMPGDGGIANFRKKAIQIAKAKIYGIDEDHEAKKTAMKHAGLFQKFDGEYVNPQGISEQSQLLLDDLRENYDIDLESTHRKGKFVLGQTITLIELRQLHKQYAKEKGLPSLSSKRLAS